jgi:pimeloyl-ACP methyl ester carboxylesterase
MTADRNAPAVSRRSALAGIGAGSLGAALGMATSPGGVVAQDDASSSLAAHPLAGVWLAMANPMLPESPQIPVPSLFAADGTVLLEFPILDRGPDGVVFTSAHVGTWEPDGERRGHFTAVQSLAAADGTFLGTVTVDGHPEVSEDGRTFVDDGSRVMVTIRDPAGAVVQQVMPTGAPAGRPVTAVRMGVGAPGFPAAAAATPAATAASPAAGTAGGTATINGAELYYEVHGDAAGQPVLLLHGAIGNTEEWDNLSPALVAAGFRVVAMDQRGRGRSAWGNAPITYAQMAADAVGLLDHLGIERTDLVGWSSGGTLCLELAVHHPDRLGRVVLYGASFTPDGEHELTPTAQVPPFEQFVADYQRLAPEPGRFEELLGVVGGLLPDYSEAELRSISVPVLVLAGEEEEFVDADQPVRMAELIPGAELVVMPGTGHFAPFAQPEEFNRIVLEFLQA